MVGGLLLVWYTYRTEALLFQLMGKNIKSFQLAVKLETALANQKGYVSYYYIDGNSQWLQQLAEFRKKFEEYLWEVKSLPNTVKEKQILEPKIVGIFEAVSEPYEDSKRIFKSPPHLNETYPLRVKVKPVKLGEVEFKPLIPKLKFITNKKKWSGHLMGKAMREIPEEDYKLIKKLL